MFSVGLPEFLLVLFVAVIMIGPKDIPHAMYTAAKIFRKIKLMANEFNRTLDVYVAEAELHEVVKEANSVVTLDEFHENQKQQAKIENAEVKVESNKDA